MSGEPEKNLNIEPNLQSPEEQELENINKNNENEDDDVNNVIDELEGHFADFMENQDLRTKKSRKYQNLYNVALNNIKYANTEKERDNYFQKFIDDLKAEEKREGKKPIEKPVREIQNPVEEIQKPVEEIQKSEREIKQAKRRQKHKEEAEKVDKKIEEEKQKLANDFKKEKEDIKEVADKAKEIENKIIETKKKIKTVEKGKQKVEQPKPSTSKTSPTPTEIGSIYFSVDGKSPTVIKKVADDIENWSTIPQRDRERLQKRIDKAMIKYPNADERRIENGKFVKIKSDLHQKGPPRADLLKVISTLTPNPKPNPPPKPEPKPKKKKLKLEPKKEKEVIEKHGLPKLEFPSSMIILGKKFVGKTNLILSIVEPIKNEFDNIYIISMTHHLNRLSILCDNDEDCILSDLSEEAIRELLKDHRENPQKTLLIFDDVVGKIDFNSKEMMKLATSGRNFGISIIISIQDIYSRMTKFKRNCEYWFLGSMTYSNIDGVSKELGIPSFPKSRIIEELSIIARDKKHDWLFYDDRKSEFKKIYF